MNANDLMQRSQVRLIRFEEQPIAQARLSTLLARLTEPYLRPEQGDELTQLRRLHLVADDGQGTVRLTLCVPGTLPNSMTIDAMTSMSLPRNDVLCSLLPRVINPLEGTGRQYLMDKRGAGVEVILQESTTLSGRAPEYRQIADMALQLTIYAAPSPHG